MDFGVTKAVLRYGALYRIVPIINFQNNKIKKIVPLKYSLLVLVLFAIAHFYTCDLRTMEIKLMDYVEAVMEMCSFLNLGLSLVIETVMDHTWNELLRTIHILQTRLKEYFMILPLFKRIMILILPMVVPYTIFFYDAWLVCLKENNVLYFSYYLLTYFFIMYGCALAAILSCLEMLTTTFINASER